MAGSGPEEKEFRQRLALAAAADVKSKTASPQQEAARNVTLTIVARTFGVSFGSIGANRQSSPFAQIVGNTAASIAMTASRALGMYQRA
jgi:hypothetical protein